LAKGLIMADKMPHLADEVFQTLDPDDWDEFRESGHKVFDDMLDMLQGAGDTPIWRDISDKAIEALGTVVPHKPQGLDAVLSSFRQNIEPFMPGNHHPRYWGWANGAGTAYGLISTMLNTAYNANNIRHRHAGAWVELQVLDWFKDILKFPCESCGLLTSGGSMANFAGLSAARTAMTGAESRQYGIAWSGVKGYTVYASSQTHFSVAKAWDQLGMGYANARKIAVDAEDRLDLVALKKQIAADRRDGYSPIAIVGTLMTVGTGAIDPMGDIADLAQDEKLWFHVDAAIGVALAFSDKYKHLAIGVERADSIAFDLHKWLQQPYDVGAVLVRHADGLKNAFSFDAPYLREIKGSVADPPVAFSDLGLELSRANRALPVWFSMQIHGVEAFGRVVEHNIDLAQYLVEQVSKAPSLQLLAPAPLNIVNLRFEPPGAAEAGLNQLNEEILRQLHRRGIAVPSPTTIDGKMSIRVCIINHRTRKKDIDILVKAIGEIGLELIGKKKDAAE
jgi:aromatic-L-amino-acid/L-tryptophan decarboxylase